MAKRPVPLYDFKAFGAAIKAARNEYGESRKKVSDELYISPRYLANIENKGQQPSLLQYALCRFRVCKAAWHKGFCPSICPCWRAFSASFCRGNRDTL